MEPQVPDHRLVDSVFVGQFIGRHPRTVLSLARTGELPSIRIGRRGVRFRLSDVEAYIERHRVGGDAP